MSPILRLARLILNDPDRARSEAQRIDAESKAKRRRVLAKSRPRRMSEERAEALAESRHRILVRLATERADGCCELCGALIVLDSEFHHLELGSVKTKNERLSNVMITHPVCHRAYHASAKSFVANVKAWCERHGYPLPNRKEYR